MPDIHMTIPLLYFEGGPNPLRGSTIEWGGHLWTVRFSSSSAVHIYRTPT